MLIESNPLLEAHSFDREREVRKRIGDYTLFLTGLFPEYAVIRVADRRRPRSSKNEQRRSLSDAACHAGRRPGRGRQAMARYLEDGPLYLERRAPARRRAMDRASRILPDPSGPADPLGPPIPSTWT